MLALSLVLLTEHVQTPRSLGINKYRENHVENVWSEGRNLWGYLENGQVSDLSCNKEQLCIQPKNKYHEGRRRASYMSATQREEIKGSRHHLRGEASRKPSASATLQCVQATHDLKVPQNYFLGNIPFFTFLSKMPCLNFSCYSQEDSHNKSDC